MFSKLFGSRNKKESSESQVEGADLSFLHTDMHSHFVPGIDDGAQTVEDSIALIRAMQNLGYKQIITTPHINFDYYPNTPETIAAGLETLRSALKAEGIEIPVKAAAEYFIDDHFMQLLDEKQPLLTIHNNEVLVEISFMFAPANLYQILFKLQTSGYKPIMAHPERYGYYHQDKQKFDELKDRGCLLQLNALSLTGYYGLPVKDAAEYMLKKGLYDYCGTDMHHVRHAENMKKLLHPKIFDVLSKYPFHNAQINF